MEAYLCSETVSRSELPRNVIELSGCLHCKKRLLAPENSSELSSEDSRLRVLGHGAMDLDRKNVTPQLCVLPKLRFVKRGPRAFYA